MPSYPLTIHLGSGEIGRKRTEEYRAWADKRRRSVSEIVVELMDREVGFTPPKQEKRRW